MVMIPHSYSEELNNISVIDRLFFYEKGWIMNTQLTGNKEARSQVSGNPNSFETMVRKCKAIALSNLTALIMQRVPRK